MLFRSSLFGLLILIQSLETVVFATEFQQNNSPTLPIEMVKPGEERRETVKTNWIQARVQAPFSDIQNTLSDPGYLFNNTKDAVINPGFLGVAAGLGLLFANDQTIRDFTQGQKNPQRDRFFADVHPLGEWTNVLYTETAIYGIGWLSGYESWRNTGRIALEASIISGGITNVLKWSVARARPFTGEGPYSRTQSGLNDEPWKSFPSADAAMSASFFAVLAARSDNIWMKALCFSSSGAVAVGRVYHDWHWSSDVFFSYVMSSYIGYTLAKPRSYRSVQNSNVQKTPQSQTSLNSYDELIETAFIPEWKLEWKDGPSLALCWSISSL